MFERINNIFIVLFFLIPFSGINAQIFIGDGLSIQENTQITIVESDLIIATDEIKGEGSINLIHSSNQNISVLEDFETNAILQVTAKNIDIEGEHKNKLALHFLPPF